MPETESATPQEAINKPGQAHLIAIIVGAIVVVLMFATAGSDGSRQQTGAGAPEAVQASSSEPSVSQTAADNSGHNNETTKTESAGAPEADVAVHAGTVSSQKAETIPTAAETGVFLVPNDHSGPPWALNLISLSTSRGTLEHVKEVEAAGYQPEVANVDIDGRLWFRVRIAGFKTARAAREAAKTFADNPQYQSMWVGGY